MLFRDDEAQGSWVLAKSLLAIIQAGNEIPQSSASILTSLYPMCLSGFAPRRMLKAELETGKLRDSQGD